MLSAPQTRGDERGTSVSNDANTVFAADTFRKKILSSLQKFLIVRVMPDNRALWFAGCVRETIFARRVREISPACA